MNNEKHWYDSKTVWGALVSALAWSLHLAGFDLALADQGVITENIIAIAGGIGGLLAIYGRVTANSMIARKRS